MRIRLHRRCGLIALASLPLGSCYLIPNTTPYYAHEARLALADRVMDIDTAKITKIKAIDSTADGKVICGSINGRNGFGAYAGFAPFAIRTRDKMVALVMPSSEPTDETSRLISACYSAKAYD